MDLRIPNATSVLSKTQLPHRAQMNAPSSGAAEGGFTQALSAALQSVSQSQNASSEMQRQVQLENPAVSLEETMIGMQKAQVGFQATLHVRNRLVQAYTDVMNMQV
jgi:flagellar hook-basal body complex protein FliE